MYIVFFTGSVARYNAYFGQGAESMLAGCVDCFGNERALLQCRTSATGIVSCSHNDDAGVECIGKHLH